VTILCALLMAAAATQEPKLDLTPLPSLPSSWGASYRTTMHAKSLGQDRRVDIFVPAIFDRTARTFPVIFLTDGEHYFERAVIAARELAESGHVPDCIVAAIETPERRQDLTPPGMSTSTSDGPDQRGERLMRFIVEELAPALKRDLRASEPFVLLGHSHGGILCHYAAAKWRREVPFIVALDAPMHLEDGVQAKQLIDSIPAGGRLRLVSVEEKFGWRDDDWSRLTARAPKDWSLVRFRAQGEDHESMVFDGFYNGLKALFADYSAIAVKGMDGPRALAHYLDLEAAYGAPVTPPEFVLERALMDLTAKGQGDRARRALALWDEGYGRRPNHDELAADIDEAEQAMKGRESVEQLLAAPPPTAAEMAPYLGVWEGASWISLDPDRRSPITVTFEVRDGQGVATAVNHDAPEEFKHETFKFLRVTSDGIEFGNMNGMFPPGVVARVARMRDGKLEGQSVFKGIYFKELNLPSHPKHYFSLTRRSSAAGPEPPR
jgi:hypothetical protein